MADAQPIVQVAEGDALARPADVLVLKHAQALHGLDRRVVEMMGPGRLPLPRPGMFARFKSPPGVAAPTVVFVGTRSRGQFTYSDVREFGSLALAAAATAVPAAREVAVTLHGVGFGLDEVESFEAEVAGIFDALERGEAPASLERVSIVEHNASRATLLQAHLASLLAAEPDGRAGLGYDSRAGSGQRDERLRRAGTDAARRPHALVAMPFDESFDDLFHYGISNAVRAAGLLCERIDRQAFTGDVMARLKRQIETAKLVVADITRANPNVSLEVGYAWGRDVPTVLLCHRESELTFDVQGQRCILYASIHDLEVKLAKELTMLLPEL